MKHTTTKRIKASIISSIIVYLVACFIRWKIITIGDISALEPAARGAIVMGALIKEFFVQFIFYEE